MGEFQPGEFINHRYRVVKRLGRGAMGTVYLTEDVLKVHRRVALKVLRSENLDDPDMWSKGEYQALIRLRHPNLALVYDFGRIQGSSDFFIVSEFIRGEDLLTATDGIEQEELLDIIAQICRALEYIHSQGYVHFDIKPDNILVTRQHSIGDDHGSKVEWVATEPSGTSAGGKGPPRVKVIDFGLAEQISGTFDFAIKGTFNYVAPEIIRGQAPDKRADLYSLGVTLHQIITGRLPFIAEDGKTITREGNAWRENIRLSLEDQPEYLTEILIRLLEEDPEKRFPTAREIIQTLSAGAGRRYLIETAETQASYLYCSRLIGRRKQLNTLKAESEAIFGQGYGGHQPEIESTEDNSADQDFVSRLLDEEGRRRAPLLMVSGEIGVGKSRLVEEFVHFLRMREIPIYVGNCYETTNDPYQPFREIITEAALALGRDSALYKKFGVLLRRLCPKLASKGEEGSGETGFRPDKDRMYFIDRLANFIIEAAHEQPFVMIVNNLHWADESSVELMSYLVQQIEKVSQSDQGPPPLMLMTTIRLDEQMSETMREFITEIRHEENVREVIVRRFSRAQIAELIHHMLQIEEISSSFLNRLEERTSGNPLFIVETLKGLQEEGIIHRDGDDWKIRGGGDLAKVDIPHGLEAILLRRVRVLDATQQRILDALAVYDKPVSGKFLERLAEFSDVDVLGQLRELENRGMVTKQLDAGKLLFSITQPKLREIVYHHIDETRRRVLHGVIADSLSEENRGNIEEIIEDLAHHYQNSDRSGKALEITIRAGDLSRSIFAHDQALEHYRHVLRQTQGDTLHRKTWLQTHEKMGDIGLISCDYELAVASYAILLGVENCEEFRTLDRSRVLRKRGKIDEIQGEYDNALRSYKAARDLVDGSSGRPDLDLEKIRVYNSIGWVYVCMGKYEKAMKISSDAQRMTGTTEAREHAMIYSTIGSANFFKGNIDEAIEYHSRALEIRENVEDIPEIVVCLNNLGSAYLANADYTEARKHFEQALATAEEIGDAFGRAMALHNLAATELQLGRNDVAEKYLQESLKLSRHYRMRFLTNKNYVLRGRLRREADDLAKAEGDLFRAMSVFAKQGNRWGLSNCLYEIAEVHLQKDSVEEALKLLHEGLANANTLNIGWLEARGRVLEVRAIRRTPNAPLEQLLETLEDAKNLVEDCRNNEMRAELEQERAEVLVAMQRISEAKQSFARAEELYRENGDRMPREYLQSYLQRHRVGTRTADEFVVREVPDGPQLSEDTAVLPAVMERAAQEMNKEQEEMLRLASLLQEAGQGVSSRIFADKVLTCLVKAVGSDDAFLLSRDGDHVRVISAIDKNAQKVKGASNRICLEALEVAFDGGDAILAPRILDNDLIGSYEVLYHNNVKSLAVMPIRIDGTCRGAIYLNNPKTNHLTPPMGSAVLAGYTSLLSLVLPRMRPMSLA